MPIQPQPLPLIQICLRHRLLIETKLFSSFEKFLSSSSDEVQNSLKSGLLKTVVQELKGLLHDLLRKEAKGSCLACGADVNERMKLEIQLHKSTENYEKLDRRMRQQEEEAKRKAEEIIDYTPHDNIAERFAKRFGAAVGHGAVKALRELAPIR